MRFSGFDLFFLTAIFLGWRYLTFAFLMGAPSHSSKTIMQIIVSLAILATSIYIILSHSFENQDKHWAYASAGTILGFWLRGSK